MNNTFLGAIDLQYTAGGGVVATDGPTNIPYSPTSDKGLLLPDQPIVKLPTDGGVTYFEGGPTGPGSGGIDLQEDKGVALPPAPTENKEPGKKSNILIWGIAGLALAYLIFRKK